MAEKLLPAMPEPVEDIERIEAAILELFKQEIFLPLLKAINLDRGVLANSRMDVASAIASGRIRYYRGRFKGRFNSTLSQELRGFGAEWDATQGSWSIPQSKLPADIVRAIALAEERMKQKLEMIDRKIAEYIPAQIAEKLKVGRIFDTTLWKTDKKFQANVRNITVAPTVTPEARARIAAEYTKNLQLYITDFTQKETQALRENIQKRVFSGARYEGMIEEIQKSYSVSANKAKFLARQETNLMVTKFTQVRYQDAGVNTYRWQCVVGSPKHPVRPMHKELNGSVFAWNDPPVVNEKGERKNPGQDYGCRCKARPIVQF